MVRCFQKGAREHTHEFRWRSHRQVERIACNSLLALFAPVFPTGATVLHFEMFFDGRLHVIIATPVVFGRHAGAIDFPSSNDVIAAPAIVVGIFDAHRRRPTRSARFACLRGCLE